MKMMIATVISVVLLCGLTSSAPVDDEASIVGLDLFNENPVIYTSKHDIVSINLPVYEVIEQDRLKIDLKKYFSEGKKSSAAIFFVLADIKENAQKEYKGLYYFQGENATKILDNGVEIASSLNPKHKNVFFAATDGLYRFDADTKKAVKYGTITDNIIGLVTLGNQDTLYIITENNELFNVTEEGTKKTKIDNVKNIQEIVVDVQDNLYFMDTEKNFFVYTSGEAKKIEGLPKVASYAKLIRGALAVREAVFAVVDGDIYVLPKNGSAVFMEMRLTVRLTAYEPAGGVLEYYASDKKIFELNLINILVPEKLEKFMNNPRL